MVDAVKRRYDSSRRQEQARENRRRILQAAHELFVNRGYGQTTIADVAARADVAVETVYAAYRNKATLLHRRGTSPSAVTTRRCCCSNGPSYARCWTNPILRPG